MPGSECAGARLAVQWVQGVWNVLPNGIAVAYGLKRLDELMDEKVAGDYLEIKSSWKQVEY